MVKKRATADERRHMSRVAELGCIVCSRQAEIHHLLRGKGMGLRASNYDVIPLCIAHHRGDEGIHSGIKTFQAKYGTEDDLLEQVRVKLSRNLF